MDAPGSNLLEWVNGVAAFGQIGALILVLRMFLERQRESERLLMDIRENYASEMAVERESHTLEQRETRTAYSAQLQYITDKTTQAREAELKAFGEMTEAFHALSDRVGDLEDRVSK